MTGQQKKQQPSAYYILSDRLRQELSNDPLDEGEVFVILDMILFSLEAEEKSYLGGLNQKFVDSIIKVLSDLDKYIGRGILRPFKLLWVGPSVLSQLIKHSHAMEDGLKKCTDMVNSIKCLKIVHFIAESGGAFATPVIQKWMEIRSVKISEQDWEKYLSQKISNHK